MATKADFTPDEWKLLLESVMMAGVAVTAADPSGLWGALKESFASARVLAEGKTSSDQLIQAIVADFSSSEGRGIARDALKADISGKSAADIKTIALDKVRQAATLLNAKAPQDAVAVKAWMRLMSEKVADASAEGGFLGFGGKPVSDAEKAMLSDIDAALHA